MGKATFLYFARTKYARFGIGEFAQFFDASNLETRRYGRAASHFFLLVLGVAGEWVRAAPCFSCPRPRLCGGEDTGEGDLERLSASNPLTPTLSPQSRGEGEELGTQSRGEGEELGMTARQSCSP
jgi:hypothetical protein